MKTLKINNKEIKAIEIKSYQKLRKMKRLTGKIKSLAMSYDRIEVILNNMNYVHFIKPSEVDWFPKDKDGNSKSGVLNIGTEIEFDGNIHPAVRALHNVKIIL